jgi:hypothetical protein
MLVGAGLLVAALAVAGAAPSGAAPYCGITWGSLPEAAPPMVVDPITGLRAGQHTCFDRLVVDLRGSHAPGYSVRYVPVVLQDGSGQPVPLRGGAFLDVFVRAPAHDTAGTPTYAPPNPAEAVAVGGFRTFRQVHFLATFEGVTQIGLGVRARLPFRVFVLRGTTSTRLVIDVAHRW